MKLVIVESPAKAKTLQRYLGKDFKVLSSYGHVRDLVAKSGAVDPDQDFQMRYEVVVKNAKHIDYIVQQLKRADALYLATDLDREGEAIAWHLLVLVRIKKALGKKPVRRIIFHEITAEAIHKAVANPRDIFMDLVYAQRARRALDHLVGFHLSPILWRTVRSGLSAGRVQSPALRLIAEREAAIEKFKSQEYWLVHAKLCKDAQKFLAQLTVYDNKKLTQLSIGTEEQALEIKNTLLAAGKAGVEVVKVVKKKRRRRPPPPFITATLQQDASHKLGFTTDRTMRVAQQLYEGVDLEAEGLVGLITYMRTDSVSLAQESVTKMRAFITEHYGKDALPAKANVYKTKSKNAQEAHEAIRPTDIARTPRAMRAQLTTDQAKLYALIWTRALACQMRAAVMDTVSIDFACGKEHLLHASGSVIVEPGFLRLYQKDSQDDTQATKAQDKSMHLPVLKEGDWVVLLDVQSSQHFTEPPPRFTEASLVKSLEERDIGRPSTYANIIYTLKYREYVVMDKKNFKLTDVGRIVSQFLTQYFQKYVDYDFTAQLENELDSIARGELAWKDSLETFWHPFQKQVLKIKETVKRSDVTQEKLDETCPECGKPLCKRLGKMGMFISCTGYPECKYARSKEGEISTSPVLEGKFCPKCQNPLQIKTGRYGKFIGCTGYPKCRHIESLEKPVDTHVVCPVCQKLHLVQKKSRYGKLFYACSGYPDCKYAIWNIPLAEPCPKCAWPILTQKETKRWGKQKVCPQKDCDFKVQITGDT